MLKEFKEFALRGNVVDLAIGVIIGGAFGGLVASAVADIIMPIIAAITGGIDFSNLYIQLSGATVAGDLEAARKAGSVLAYGNFVTLVINFIIIAFVLFLVIKAMNAAKKPAPAAPAAPPAPPADVLLLTEIRDLLKSR